jgi:hypothetical protein
MELLIRLSHPFASQTYAYQKTASLSHKLGNINGISWKLLNGRKKKIFVGHASHWRIMSER